ncbi:hypothetical protein BCR35DRAFT_308741 [Leucosporidium creatinivorum]|uniref:Uncharacterized protein n=1 Tax=Leucosporidium creatinivorum TaxID=106004 RepID=A0A1Y2DZV7_9BASI|nr:hypothetical protein BCR35DRAFT_308741 [Leucosporidium creatinivorum]
MQPSITVSPTAASRTLPPHSTSPPSSGGRSPSHSRTRSLSPGASSSLNPSPTSHAPLSPRSSQILGRPSPVVPSPSLPASPASFSRPSSPRPHEPASPTRATSQLPYELGSSGMLSRSGSAVDLSHVFERDVEFGSTHVISAQEAVDVAIAPVLDEAALALSSASDQQARDLLRDAQDEASSSGWSSPVGASPISHPGRHSYANASRSPTRSMGGGEGRSFSPSSVDGGRATSPGSSTSFSIGTPPDETLHPFSQGLSDALEKTEAARTTGLGGGLDDDRSPGGSSLFNPSQLGGEIVLPPPVMPTGLPAKSMLAMPIPFPNAASFDSPAGSIPASPSIETVNPSNPAKARRLSFLSYADVINEERLAELTGAPAGGEVPSTGGAPDLATVLNRLELSAEEQQFGL